MNRVLGIYRNLPDLYALIVAIIFSFLASLAIGVAVGVAAMFAYDGATSRGDDLGILLTGMLSAGGFGWVFFLSWLRSLHSDISSRTPTVALASLFLVAVIATLFFVYPDYYGFALGSWVLIALSTGGAWLLSNWRFVRDKRSEGRLGMFHG